MADPAVGIDYGLLAMVCFCGRLMMVLVMPKMPFERSRFLMLAIGGGSRPAKLKRQKHQEKNQAKAPHVEWMESSVAGTMRDGMSTLRYRSDIAQ
ncbi:Secreted protein [Ralstonia mannitolilytica]|jgi:hypothetical protein|nr:hypothetical protein [Ralstonia mannitolilytica]ANA35772.1 hypothetical protein VZ52_20490 [Ralstonia mannitolilytica]MBU9580871.1 hypothetical protein [Ralstonia mannitolilytica]CAJ0686924.1 hypothetical protein R82526_02894 [Ralstonia mannitolilytica]CAJ0804466.1 hypothetical protein R77555_04128 [Ralstonia mannitolilytica]CAJ0856082.1 hypothetical protein R76727_01041 [Ralstonia mannitolilytica]